VTALPVANVIARATVDVVACAVLIVEANPEPADRPVVCVKVTDDACAFARVAVIDIGTDVAVNPVDENVYVDDAMSAVPVIVT